jgi:hypothetical protein
VDRDHPIERHSELPASDLETDVVTRLRVAGAGIAEADDENALAGWRIRPGIVATPATTKERQELLLVA